MTILNKESHQTEELEEGVERGFDFAYLHKGEQSLWRGFKNTSTSVSAILMTVKSQGHL